MSSPAIKNEPLDGVTDAIESKKDATVRREDGDVRVFSQKDRDAAGDGDAGGALNPGVKKESSSAAGGVRLHNKPEVDADSDKRDKNDNIDVEDGRDDEDDEDEEYAGDDDDDDAGDDDEDDDDYDNDEGGNVPRLSPREYIMYLLEMGEPSIDPENYHRAVYLVQWAKELDAMERLIDILKALPESIGASNS